jgi:predicted DNA-binding transcriptional regulator AlpA
MTNTNSTDPSPSFDGSERLLPRRELRKLVPVSDMTIWRWEREDRFPRHLSIHGRNYWLRSEVHHWISVQKRETRFGSENDK